MAERWTRTTSTKVLEVELVEVEPPATWSAAWDQTVGVEIRMADGEVFQRYSSVELARRILVHRGFVRSDRLVGMPVDVDEPRSVV